MNKDTEVGYVIFDTEDVTYVWGFFDVTALCGIRWMKEHTLSPMTLDKTNIDKVFTSRDDANVHCMASNRNVVTWEEALEIEAMRTL